VPLPVGLFSNAYRLNLPDTQRFWCVSITGTGPRNRRQVEQELGVPVWMERDNAFTTEEVAGADKLEFPTMTPERANLVLFGLREALRSRARECNWQHWFSMSEFRAVPPDQEETYGPVIVEPLLKVRVAHEGVKELEFLFVLSSGVRWRMSGDLTDTELAAVAPGESIFRLGGDGPERGTVVRVEGDDLYIALGKEELDEPHKAKDYSLVARPVLVNTFLNRTCSPDEARSVYHSLLVASGTLMADHSLNRYAVKGRYQSTEELINEFGRTFSLPTGGSVEIAGAPIEIFARKSRELHSPEDASTRWLGSVMPSPRLRFGEGIPSRASEQAYGGLRRFGAFSLHDFRPEGAHFLLVYPKEFEHYAQLLREKLFDGLGNYPGFKRLFGLPAEFCSEITEYVIEDGTGGADTADLYRRRLSEWAQSSEQEPDLAIVIHPHSDRWETETPYYVAKAFFGGRGIPTQMVTSDLLIDERKLGWSLANIALASFAKLGGWPWVVDARDGGSDLVVGIGRADIKDGEGRRRIFGYAVGFVSNGAYLDISSFPPVADESDYQERLTDAIAETLKTIQSDQPPTRVVIHLAKRTGWMEINASEAALKIAGYSTVPIAFLRVDDSSLYEFMDGGQATYAAPKGLAVRLSERRALVQTEGATNHGSARRPLLLELDQRSTVDPDDLGLLTLQVFRLAHANWRGFNARSKPVTLLYGERLAELAGYLSQAGEWDPATLKPELRRRPWFL
jgi:hypothetical protein